MDAAFAEAHWTLDNIAALDVQALRDERTAEVMNAYARCHPLPQGMVDGLLSEGVNVSAVMEGWPSLLCPPRCARVVVDGRTFEFARDKGEPDDAPGAMILPAFDAEGDLSDLAAWKMGPGGFLATWHGRAAMLGEEQALRTRDGPLLIHADPLAWLRAGRRGVVILDLALARPLLHEAGPLAAADARHAVRLRADLAIPPPRIEVAASPLIRAA